MTLAEGADPWNCIVVWLMKLHRGDVRAVQEIIQSSDINLNAVDEFDYSPLTLVSSLALRLTLFVPVTLGVEASLCGHYDVVQLLLESGALCVRSTFQGERWELDFFIQYQVYCVLKTERQVSVCCTHRGHKGPPSSI